MGKGSKAPKAPDMTIATDKTAAASKAGAYDVRDANRYTQVGAEGSTNRWDPTTGANITTMGAQPQAAYDAMMAATTGNMGAFQNKYWGGGGGSTPAPGVNNANVAWGHGTSTFNPSTVGGGPYGAPASDGSPVGVGIQKDLDYSKLTAMPGEDIGAARQQAQDALYGRSAGYLDPQWQESQRSTEAQLANQGLTPGTPAYDRAYANMQRAKEAAYTGARQDAIAGGGAEAARAQEMALQLRNQGVLEAGNLGAFHNAAQGQGANQWLTKHGQDTSADAQIQSAQIGAGASVANAQLANELNTRQQAFNEIMQSGQAANQYLPQFNTSQGNLGQYDTADYVGAESANYANEMARNNANTARKQFLPKLIGGVAGSALGGPIGGQIGTKIAGMF